MKKTLLATAALIAACAAQAQSSSVQIYGTVDLAADTTERTAGAATLLRSSVGRKERLAPSMSSISALGFKGTEDLGGGMKAGFVLEMQPTPDDGTLGNDGRAWGRQAYVSLTTPYGEVRLGRQYAPFFYAKAFSTTERLAGTDLFTGLLTINQLQVRQDNQVSYWAKVGGFTASVAVSPNAGVPAGGINANRSAGGTNANSAQILGGQTAGTEGRGRTWGAFINWMDKPESMGREGFSLSAAYHANKFGVPLFLGTSSAQTSQLGILDDYDSFVLAGRYVAPNEAWAVAAAYGEGQYKFKFRNPLVPELSDGIDIRSFVFGGKVTVTERLQIGAMYGVQKFRNFTKGKDTAFVLGADYNLSKRTTVYARYGYLKDDEGNRLQALPVSGGPEPILVATGLREVPVWNGVGVNPGGKSTTLGIGIRHTF